MHQKSRNVGFGVFFTSLNEKEELLADIVEHKKIIARKTMLVKILEDVIQQLKNQH